MNYDFNLDEDGYPTEEWINFIKKFDGNTMPIMDFVELWKANWWQLNYGFHMKRKYKGIIKLYVSTGGWSGNEETINAIVSNFWLNISLGYYQWNRGGHYIFHIPIDKYKLKSAMRK